MFGCSACRMARRSFLALGAYAFQGAAATAAMAATPSKPKDSNLKPGQARVVDFHAHFIEDSLPTNIGPQLNSPQLQEWIRQFKSPDAHIEQMDRIGVSAHVVSYSNATQGVTWGDADADLKAYRQINDGVYNKWVKAHPGRFFGAFSLPTDHMHLALPELERCVGKLGHKVLQISSCSPAGIYYGDKRFDPLWKAVEEAKVTVFIHPHGQDDKAPFDDFGLANSVGQGVEEIKVMTSMIYNGVFDKFPNLKVVVAHGGGFLPHYYGRLDRNAAERPATVRNIKKLPSSYLKGFYYDTCVYGPEILAALIKIVGSDRIVLGSDFPVGERDGMSSLRATPGLSAAEIERITAGTPAHLLNL